MNFLDRWQMRRSAREMLRHSDHVCGMREDVAEPGALRELRDADSSLRRCLRERRHGETEAAMDRLDRAMRTVMPPRPHAKVREYVEIAAVALGVAMACRSYFVQPFKIPTGSMQPSLYGIHYSPQRAPEFADRWPFRLAKWFVTGEWYVEVKARATGHVMMLTPERTTVAPVRDGEVILPAVFSVGGVAHTVHPRMAAHVMPGEMVFEGQLLASGIRTAGDHVFVDRVSWNFRRPRRSEVMVFLTNGIEGLKANWNKHYIKRTVGLPGEEIAVAPPFVTADGQRIRDRRIGEIALNGAGNGGYRFAEGYPQAVLKGTSDVIRTSADEYVVMGDNTLSSFDSRFWGTVARSNLVGEAFVVYWPMTRWHWISR